jgi:hypothetical protein
MALTKEIAVDRATRIWRAGALDPAPALRAPRTGNRPAERAEAPSERP